MSKITKALGRAREERLHAISPVEEKNKNFMNWIREGNMRKSWILWGVVICAVTIFIAFNYQGGQDAVPLSEIFPDEREVEYEFVQDEPVASKVTESVVSAVVVSENTKKPTEAAKTQSIPQVETVQAVSVASSTPVVTKDSNFTVQIASFKDEKKAQAALTKIQTSIPSAYISRNDLGAKGVWYRIYAGQFERRSEAEVSLSAIKRNYDSSFIISHKSSR